MTLAKKRTITFLLAFALVFAGVAILSADYSYAATKKPGKVTGLKYTKDKKDANAFKLSWKKVKNAKKYEVYIGFEFEDGIDWEIEKTVKGTSCKLTTGQLHPYYYKVRAVNGSKKGAFSKKVKVKLPIKYYSGTKVPNFGGLFNWGLHKNITEGDCTCYYYIGVGSSYYGEIYTNKYIEYLEDTGWTQTTVDGNYWFVKDSNSVGIRLDEIDVNVFQIIIKIK